MGREAKGFDGVGWDGIRWGGVGWDVGGVGTTLRVLGFGVVE